MNHNDFILHAIRAEAHYVRHWVLRAFSITREAPDAWEAKKTPWQIVHSPTGYFFVNEQQELQPIEGADPTKPLYNPDMDLMVPAGFFQHWPEGGLTKPGNLLWNAAALWPSVGGRLGYVNGEFDIGKFEQKFAKMVDTPLDGGQRDPNIIYVDEYLKFCDAVRYLEEFTQVFCWSVTEKSITAPDGVEEFKAKLFEEYGDKINDPVTQAEIYKRLGEFDKGTWLKGDESERFLISNKSHNVRRKLFMAQGAEAGLASDNQQIPFIKNSLAQGWEIDKFPQYINTQRAGSIDRGSETELGGVVAKWLARSTSNVRVRQDFCGTKIGDLMTVTEENRHELVGRWLVSNQPILVPTDEDSKQYLGKRLQVLSPHFCKHTKTDYCKFCLGVNLSANEDAVSLAANSYGGGFLDIFLKAMHGKEVKTAIVLLEEVMS